VELPHRFPVFRDILVLLAHELTPNYHKSFDQKIISQYPVDCILLYNIIAYYMSTEGITMKEGTYAYII